MKGRAFLAALALTLVIALSPSQVRAQETAPDVPTQETSVTEPVEAPMDYTIVVTALKDAATQLSALEGAEIKEVRFIDVDEITTSLDETQKAEITPLIEAATSLNENEAVTGILTTHTLTLEENTSIIGVAVQDNSLVVVTKKQL